MSDQASSAMGGNDETPYKSDTSAQGIQSKSPNVPAGATERGSKPLVTLDSTGLAFRPKYGSKSLSIPHSTVLAVRPKCDSTNAIRDATKVVEKQGNTLSSEPSTNLSTSQGEQIPDEVLLKYVADLAKGKPLQEVIRELLQEGIVHEGFVEEELVATLLRASTYSSD
jgi:hypothetical protein